jgi:acetyl-CoA acetyltransferase
LSDGAASVLVASDKMIGQLQPKQAFRIVATSVVSLEPSQLFIAPVFATQKVLAAANCKLHEVDLFEINEAFASQTLACIRQLGVDPQQVNVNGGAIALGHPIGCSGARILVTLMHALLNRRLRRGVATICIGGGEAIALLIENANCS